MTDFNTIINRKQRLMIHAAHRCGSSHLLRMPDVLKGWEIIQRYELDNTSDYKEFRHVNIIRDPYQRWRSWFYDFKNSNDDEWTKKWSLDYAKNWVDTFQHEMHYDIHTCLQKMVYADPVCSNNAIYLNMEDLDIFLNRTNSRHNIDHRKIYESQINFRVIGYLQVKIPFIYRADYQWMQNLNIWQSNT